MRTELLIITTLAILLLLAGLHILVLSSELRGLRYKLRELLKNVVGTGDSTGS